MYILKWCIEYPAVIKQLLLKITSVEFLQLYASKAESKIYLGIAHCCSANVQGGFAEVWHCHPNHATLRGVVGMAVPYRLLVVCVCTHSTQMANLPGEGALGVEGKFWTILKVSVASSKRSCLEDLLKLQLMEWISLLHKQGPAETTKSHLKKYHFFIS